ncbi:MAG: phenylalanine--tRNA ligase subunit beta [Nitrososphaerales archaeon]|nr:phenylalanine--tRNA ligase subunit beta [Nitrososphaerales archaeon]
MPVVRIELPRFSRMVGADGKRILDRLPYLGLDIEGLDRESVRVEYSPNRPDFGTDYGIARALRGLLGKELGPPSFSLSPSGITVAVDRRLAPIRPFIACVSAEGLRMDGEDVRQLISLQEDLHNGLGRRRKRVAIGLHDMKAISQPIDYVARTTSFRFRPLQGKRDMSLSEILSETDQGKQYGGFFGRTRLLPIISDSKGLVLSFPPVINGNGTKVSAKTTSLFVDVTSTDKRAGDDVLAVLATTLAAMGAKIGSVAINYPDERRVTPDLKGTWIPLDLRLLERVIGLGLSKGETIKCLRRSRLGVIGNRVLVPRYRIDMIHAVDVAEEVALGYGFDRVGSLYPESRQPGSFNSFNQFLERTADLMSGSGMVELMTYELVDDCMLYENFGRSQERRIVVENPRSVEHSTLRDSVLPSMMAALGRNVKEDYPQRVFEVGRVYLREKGGVAERWRLGCLIAHSQSSFTESKMHLESLVRLLTEREALTKQSSHWAFAEGRTASVSVGREELGFVGEVKPEAVSAFRLGLPVSGFELDVSSLYKQLK